MTGDETWGFHHTRGSKQVGKKFDDDDEVQEDVMKSYCGLKGWRQTSMTRGTEADSKT